MKLTKIEYKLAHIEGEVNYVDQETGPSYYEYGVRFADSHGRSLGYMQCGWSTNKRSANALMRAAVVRMTNVVDTTDTTRSNA